MKKFIATVPSGGAPIFAQELVSDVLTKETWAAIEAILGTLEPSKYSGGVLVNENIVLSGGIPTDVGGGQFDISAGIAYFPSQGGIIAEFPAITGFTPGFLGATNINLDTPTVEQKTYFDSGVKDYTETYTATVGGSNTADSIFAFITSGTSRFPSLQTIIDSAVSQVSQRLSGLSFLDIPIPPWDMNTTASITVSIPGVSSDKFISAEAWIRENDVTSTRWRRIIWTDDGSYNGRLEIRGNAADEATAPMDALLFADPAGLFGTDAGYAGTSADRGKLKITYLNT